MSLFENTFGNSLRYVREHPECRRIGLFLVLGIMLWVSAVTLTGWQDELSGRITIKEKRYASLVDVIRTYRVQPGEAETPEAPKGDPLTVLSRLLDSVGIKDRLVQLSSASSGVSLQVDGLYPGELGTLLQEVMRLGLPILSCEIRAVPAGSERRLACSLLVGGRKR